MTRRQHVARIILLLLAALVAGCDQYSKSLVRRHVTGPRSFLGGSVEILHAENRGGFLSLGSGLPDYLSMGLFVAGAAALLAGVAVLLWRSAPELRTGAAVALLLGGGMGNLIDRVGRGGFVTDFMILRLGPLHTGIFNVGDVALTCGIAWLLIATQLRKKKNPVSAATS